MVELLLKANRFQFIKRTTGISTTDITSRLLKLIDTDENEPEPSIGLLNRFTEPPKQQFLQTSTRIANFSNKTEPGLSDTVVYF